MKGRTNHFHSARAPYVLWDWNGTLLDDTAAGIGAFTEVFRRRGLPAMTRSWYRRHFAFPVRPVYAARGVDLAHEDWAALAREYHAAYLKRPKQLNAEARAAVSLVAARGAGQSILSALRQDLLDQAVEASGIRPFFDFVCGVDNLDGATKLARARELLARLRERGVSGDVVMVGDAIHDWEVAEDLGVGCVLCACGGHSVRRLRAVAPTGRTLLEVLKIIGL